MNAAEAKKILTPPGEGRGLTGTLSEISMAIGYLEALEGPEVEALVIAVKQAMAVLDLTPHDDGVVRHNLKEALAQHREAVKK